MRSRKSKKGASGLFGQVIGWLLAGTFLILWFNVPADPTVNGVIANAESRIATMDSWLQNCMPKAVKGDFSMCSLKANVGGTDKNPADWTGGGTKPSDPGTKPDTKPAPVDPKPSTPGGNNNGNVSATAAESLAALDKLKTENPKSVPYDRSEWPHWSSQGSACWDTRDQVLFDEAVKDSTLILTDKAGNPTTDMKKACAVKAGTWNEPYSGGVIHDPKGIDIDHMIPLSYAAKQGGQEWSRDKKQQFANDLEFADHLVAVTAKDNRQKGDKGPAAWKPKNKGYHCQYAQAWITISTNYQLSVPEADKKALRSMLETCG